MKDNDFGKLLLRVTIACLLLFHGYAKIKYGLGFIEGLLLSKGIPAFVSYFVFMGEILAPLLLILGYKTKLAATMIICTMVTAIYLVYPNDLTTLTKVGALKLENIYFFLFTSLILVFMGPGKYSIDRN